MENLEKIIDTMVRDRVVSLHQENSVRITKINVRYTTSNKKNTIARLEAIYDSYEKTLRALPKEWLSVEKTVRLKYRTPMDETRKLKTLVQIDAEMEAILLKLVRGFKPEFEKLGFAETFDKKIAASRSWMAQAVESQTVKLMESLKAELETDKIPPGDLSRMYGIEESALIDLQLIDLLQDINLHFKQMMGDDACRLAVDGVQEAIKTCVQVLKKLERGEGGAFMTPETRKESRLQIARASLRVKDLIVHVGYLLEQLRQPEEARNPEIIRKIRERIREIFEKQIDGDLVLSQVLPLYELLGRKEGVEP